MTGLFLWRGTVYKNYVISNNTEVYYLHAIRSGAIQVGCAVHKPCDIVKEHSSKHVNTKKENPQ